MASKNSVPFQVHYKVDPAILTFVNPVSAFHASENFISWTQNEGAKHKIYNINAPKPPILINNNGNFNSTLVSYGYKNNGSSNRVWTANGQVTIYYGFGGSRIYNNEPILVYDNVKTIKCSYKSYNLENSSSGTTDPYGTARAIIRLNKKEKGFLSKPIFIFAPDRAVHKPVAAYL